MWCGTFLSSRVIARIHAPIECLVWVTEALEDSAEGTREAEAEEDISRKLELLEFDSESILIYIKKRSWVYLQYCILIYAQFT